MRGLKTYNIGCGIQIDDQLKTLRSIPAANPRMEAGARANGEGIYFSVINYLLGGALALMVRLATLLLVVIPMQIAYEGA
ncbi:hypothetical protein QWJ46_18240 [Rhizobium sp. CBN3]|uniref:hypothetical protein n=1 Tax=Rhizobium sp. CBN3 TaxID=3058045 RepID=UPI002672E24A|nr:hypothetical protein [Rhizobium sp. CBN3]MDO3434617.1 hypothetical protein [Rhizobium sp. CBN3]